MESMSDAAETSERRLTAISVSHGIGIGRLVFFGDDALIASNDSQNLPDAELERLHSAAELCRLQLKEILAASQVNEPPHVIDIFDLQLLILDQSSLLSKVEDKIIQNRVNAETALKEVTGELVGRQSNVSDQHLREKHLDIADVCDRLESALRGSRPYGKDKYLGAIVAAFELRPSTMLELKKSNPAGIITERGGWTSHTSILAREFLIPMVTGIRIDSLTALEGSDVIVDGERGIVVCGASQQTVSEYEQIALAHQFDRVNTGNTGSELMTRDGVRIAIRANVDSIEAFKRASDLGAEGIGLFRSESLILRAGEIPTEDEQVVAYRNIAAEACKDGIRIRTFDVGVDYLRGNPSRTEINPSLGLRSIRLSLNEQHHFRTQIRAILRASVNNRIDILLPMVSGVTEIIAAQKIINEERNRLSELGVEIGEPSLGAMIEVPSGVFTARDILRHVDLLALGTNDLVQYLLAIDRDNDAVAEWYQTLHPAVIRAVREVISAATDVGKPILICGEMAGSAFYVPVLVGLGATELSMNINSINQIQRLVSGITLDECTELLALINGCETSDETEDILRSFYTERWSNLFPKGILSAKHR